MTVTPSNIVSEEVIATVTDLWTPDVILKPTWVNPLVLASAWSTTIDRTNEDVLIRRGLTGKPQRSLSLPFWSSTREEALRLHSMLRRIGTARFLMPLSCDISVTSSTSSGTTINCDTTYRRFFANGYAAIGEFNWTENALGNYELVQISSLSSAQITLEASLTTSFPAGSVVVPLVECYLSREGSQVAQSDKVSVATVAGLEVVGDPALDTTFAAGYALPGSYTHAGFPIWQPNINWRQAVELNTLRTGSESSQGIEQVVTVEGSWPKTRISFLLTHFDREEAWQTIQFFDSRAGSLYPFWVADPVADYDYIEHLGSLMIVTSNGPELDWQFRPYLFVEFSSGALAIRTIESATRVSGRDELTLDSTLSSQPIKRISPAYLVHFASDEMQENWFTNTVMETSLSVEEVGDESDVVIAGISRTEVSPANFAFSDDGCPSNILLTDCEESAGNIITSEDYVTLPAGALSTGDLIGRAIKLSSGGASADTCYLVTATDTVGTTPITVSDIYEFCGQCLGLYVAVDCEGVEDDLILDDDTTDLSAVSASSLAELAGDGTDLGTQTIRFSSGGASTETCYRIRNITEDDPQTPSAATVSRQYTNCDACLFQYVAYSCDTPGLQFSFSESSAVVTAGGYSSAADIPLYKIIKVDNTFDGAITPGCYIIREWTESDNPSLNSPDITDVYDHCGLCLEWVVAEDCAGNAPDMILNNAFGVGDYVGDGTAHTLSVDGYARCWRFRAWVDSDGNIPIPTAIGTSFDSCLDCIESEDPPPGDGLGYYVPCDCDDVPSIYKEVSLLVVGYASLSACEDCDNDEVGHDPAGDPLWDGILAPPSNPANCQWATEGDIRIIGEWAGTASLSLTVPAGPNPTCYWTLSIGCYSGQSFNAIWVGTKEFGDNPTGEYTRTGGCDTTASLLVSVT